MRLLLILLLGVLFASCNTARKAIAPTANETIAAKKAVEEMALLPYTFGEGSSVQIFPNFLAGALNKTQRIELPYPASVTNEGGKVSFQADFMLSGSDISQTGTIEISGSPAEILSGTPRIRRITLPGSGKVYNLTPTTADALARTAPGREPNPIMVYPSKPSQPTWTAYDTAEFYRLTNKAFRFDGGINFVGHVQGCPNCVGFPLGTDYYRAETARYYPPTMQTPYHHLRVVGRAGTDVVVVNLYATHTGPKDWSVAVLAPTPPNSVTKNGVELNPNFLPDK